MSGKIAVIDFPDEGKETSWFVVNDANTSRGKGGLVACVKNHNFEPELVRYDQIPQEFDPEQYSAVFFASGYTTIRANPENKDDRDINPKLKRACEIYGKCIEAGKMVIAWTHSGQILTFHTGGDYFKLRKERQRLGLNMNYYPADEQSSKHWLLKEPNEISINDLTAREYRKYGTDSKNSDFTPLVLTHVKSAGPAIAVHRNSDIDAVLLFMHPEFDKNLSAYGLMENIFARVRQKHMKD